MINYTFYDWLLRKEKPSGLRSFKPSHPVEWLDCNNHLWIDWTHDSAHQIQSKKVTSKL